jgi:hypothetical protein
LLGTRWSDRESIPMFGCVVYGSRRRSETGRDMNKKSFLGHPVGLRRPEYTGENRCLPCTIVNLVLAGALAGTVAVLSVPAGVALAGVAVTLIYLRGYLIPGTPELTKRYLPGQVRDAFGAHRSKGQTTGTVDPGVVLVAAGALVDSPESSDASMEPVFAARLGVRTRELRRGDPGQRRRELASLLDVPTDDVAIVPTGSGRTVLLGEERLGTWESPAALDTDLAAMALLREQSDIWDRFDVGVWSEIAGTLRLFVETCPDCDGTVALDEVTVESCCSSQRVVAATCEDCGVRMLELSLSADELAAAADDGQS